MSNFLRPFNTAAGKTVTMWKARYVNPRTGEVSIVQAHGRKLEEGSSYYMPAAHKGHLKCFHCDAKVHHRDGPVALGGNSADGHDNHFATNPKQKHGDECEWEFPEPWESTTEKDKNLGWTINLNVPFFHKESVQTVGGVWGRVAGSPLIRAKTPQLRAQETKSVGSADDLIRIIQNADTDRLARSLVSFRNQPLKWSEFCLRRDTPLRYLDRIQKMQRKVSDGAKAPETFGLFEVKTVDKYYFPPRGKKSDRKINAMAVNLKEKDYRRKPQNVIVSLDLSECHDSRATVAFQGSDRSFMILGNAVYTRHQANNFTTHYFNIKITSVDQIAVVDVKDLWAKVRKKNGLGVVDAPIPPKSSKKPDVMTSHGGAEPIVRQPRLPGL